MNGVVSRLIAALAIASCLGCGTGDQEEEGVAVTRPADTTLQEDTLRTGSIERAVQGQTLYVPAYSSIHIRTQERSINLTTTLSVRNTDPDRSLTVTKVNYFDSDGQLAHRYLEGPRQLKPLASTSFVVDEEDERGGVGANFVVAWSADQPITVPVVETVMISARSTQGISFTSPARILSEKR